MEPLQNIKGVFFDLYGTLLIYGDMRTAWMNWFTAFYSKLVPFGLSISQESFSRECDQFFGPEPPPKGKDRRTVFETRIHNLCDQLGVTPSLKEVAGIADFIAEVWEKQVQVDPDAATVLGLLKEGKNLALVSNFDHPRHARKVISKHQLTNYFHSIIISGDVGFKKPDPRIFELAMEETGFSPSEAVYVGDTEEDMAAARAAGIIPIRIQRPENHKDHNFFPFKSENDSGVLVAGQRVEDDLSKITSLKELLSLV